MQKTFFLGAILFAPVIMLAHDGEHIVAPWYQEPTIIVSTIVAVTALSALSFGLITKRKRFIATPAVVLGLISVVGIGSLNQGNNIYGEELAVTKFGEGQLITLYKSPNCGCCSGHAKALEQVGFDVTIKETNDLAFVKQTHNIPLEGESCHTSVIDDYVVEGHVPLGAIEKLVTEKPDIAGIGLSGMPIGTPGMPGPKTTPYDVYQLSEEGQMSPYLTI